MTGGSGRFAKVFKKINQKEKIFYPSKKNLDINNINSVRRYIKKIKSIMKLKNGKGKCIL